MASGILWKARQVFRTSERFFHRDDGEFAKELRRVGGEVCGFNDDFALRIKPGDVAMAFAYPMNVKMFFRAFVFLLLLFVVMYVGMNNTHKIDFYFPVLSDRRINARAALLFFGTFAIGVLAGMVLNAGSHGGSGQTSAAKRR